MTGAGYPDAARLESLLDGLHDAARHLPLGRALQEYAGAGSRDMLLGLLLPVNRAAEESPWLRALVGSGAVFRPLASRRQPTPTSSCAISRCWKPPASWSAFPTGASRSSRRGRR